MEISGQTIATILGIIVSILIWLNTRIFNKLDSIEGKIDNNRTEFYNKVSSLEGRIARIEALQGV